MDEKSIFPVGKEECLFPTEKEKIIGLIKLYQKINKGINTTFQEEDQKEALRRIGDDLVELILDFIGVPTNTNQYFNLSMEVGLVPLGGYEGKYYERNLFLYGCFFGERDPEDIYNDLVKLYTEEVERDCLY